MFQYLRSCDVAVFGDVADQYDRNAGHLGEMQKDGSHFLDLGDRACRRIHIGRKHRLHRVHNHQVRLQRISLGNDVVYVRLAENEAVGVVSSKSVRTHLDLSRAFLARDVKRLETGRAKRNLKGQCGFADAWLAADQHQ